MADADELTRLISTRREGLALEFKRSMAWTDPTTRGKVVRTALALANVRDGGVLAFGLEQNESNPLYELVGMSPADHDSFTQDGVSSTVNSHATPHIDLSVEHLTIGGRPFVAIVVRQFISTPNTRHQRRHAAPSAVCRC